MTRQEPSAISHPQSGVTGPVVSAVLVNYNAGHELRHALQSIVDELADQPWEAVVVDNDSKDSSADSAAEFQPKVSVIRNRENVGFARGVNQGLAATTGPLVLIMNPDCRLMAGAIGVLRAELSRHPSCAIVGPKILNPDGSLQGSARGDPDTLTGLFGRNQLLGRLLPWLPVARRNVVSENAIRTGQPSVVVDWLSGACMLARRTPLEEMGGFDQRYFLYWEDADLCRRLRSAGYQNRYVPGASAIHRVGESSRTAQAAAIRAFHDSAYLYYMTHVAPQRLHPMRALAGMILAARQWWLLRRD